ncbi:hypothetical protein Riv7116_1265 [Rivularia sp. PCC 7116]|nr:hypothetical protein Riv7116_1265 [Rivularia sp. PCC 7116]
MQYIPQLTEGRVLSTSNTGLSAKFYIAMILALN